MTLTVLLGLKTQQNKTFTLLCMASVFKLLTVKLQIKLGFEMEMTTV